MALPHIFGAVAGAGLQAVGKTADFFPGNGQSYLTKLGKSVSDPNQVYTGGQPGAAGLLGGYGDSVPSFSTVNRPQTLGASTTFAPPPGNNPPGPVNTGNQGAPVSYNPADIALLDAGIGRTNSAIGLLDRQQQVGDENINNSYNSALNRLLGSQAQAQRDYDTTKNQTTQDNINARNDITTSVGRQANSAQRYLGSRGAGNSTAARIAAPYAAAVQGTQQLRQVGDAFQRNMQGLDTNFSDYQTGVQQSRQDLDQNVFQNRQALKANVAEKRANLLSQLAGLNSNRSLAAGGNSAAALQAANPYLNQVDALQGQITDLGAQYAGPINVNTPTYSTPELSQYQYEQAGVPGGQANVPDAVSPNFYSLLGLRRQNNGLGF